MARSRAQAVELARLLNAADQPIYVLDEEHTVVFCNRACLEWVGRGREELEGLTATYHAPVDQSSPEAVAAALCPPPAAMRGGRLSGEIEVPLADGLTSRRRARLVPLGEPPAEKGGLIVLVDPHDLAESQEEPRESETEQLHRRLREFRRRAVGRYQVDRLVGDSPAIRRARQQVALAAAGGASVLLVGPPGSGRQHVAATIHYADVRTGAMIPLACSVLGAELIRSTIHALASRKWSEGGAAPTTLVLNNAEMLPPEVQRETAAVLGAKSFPLRLIATAAAPLEDLARRGEYREELAFLLSTITIELPPLARRREDLPLLAQWFVEEANAQGGKQLAGFSPEALDRLHGYAWPGNVDELAEIVLQSHQRAEGPEITAADLPERFRLAAAAEAHPPRKEESILLDEFLGRIERELIERALARSKGNKSQAAKLLGLTRPRLYRRLVQLGMEK